MEYFYLYSHSIGIKQFSLFKRCKFIVFKKLKYDNLELTQDRPLTQLYPTPSPHLSNQLYLLFQHLNIMSTLIGSPQSRINHTWVKVNFEAFDNILCQIQFQFKLSLQNTKNVRDNPVFWSLSNNPPPIIFLVNKGKLSVFYCYF